MTHTYIDLSILNIATIRRSSLIGYVNADTHKHTLALPVVLMSIDIKQCARNYVKMGRRRRLRTHKYIG
jgi:uncharacterized membrane protein